MDDFDRALLRRLQLNNQLTHAELAEEVHLSASSVRRRLKVLRESGVIRADVSLLDLGESWIQVIVMVSFKEESVEAYQAFRERMLESPEVTQVYSVSGDVDFIIHCHAPDLPSYEAWGERLLMSDPSIRRYDSHVVYSQVKFDTALPV